MDLGGGGINSTTPRSTSLKKHRPSTSPSRSIHSPINPFVSKHWSSSTAPATPKQSGEEPIRNSSPQGLVDDL